MGMFNAFDAAVSGATVSRVWIDAISDNVANVNTARNPNDEPFRARMVEVNAVARGQNEAGGARVVAIRDRQGDPVLALDPSNPLADDRGRIAMPVVDLGVEMTNMLIANRAYQANVRVIEQARDVYRSALQIGSRQ
jgi:flagellar basal-body rod protein FlgC